MYCWLLLQIYPSETVKTGFVLQGHKYDEVPP